MSVIRGISLHKDILLIFKRLKYQNNDRIINTVNIPNRCSLGRGCRLEWGVHIGRDSSLGDWSYLRDYSYLWPCSSVGKYCSIGERVSIGVPVHPIDFVSTSSVLYHHKSIDELVLWPKDDIINPAVIGNDVWIGNNVTIMQGVNVGDGAVIGAGAVVTHNVSAYSIVAGCPAKEIKKRFTEDIIGRLIASQWWNLEYEELTGLLGYQNNVEEFLNRLEESNPRNP